jgi:hypothetical protein
VFGRAVDARADGHERSEVLVVVVRGPLEHEVLEEMRESRATFDLVLRADAVPDVHLHEGDGMVFGEDHVESVLQHVGIERNRGFRGRRR